MRQSTILIFITAILNFHCTSSRVKSAKMEIDYEGVYKVDSAYRELPVDKAILEKVVMNNRDFFETYTEHIHDDDQYPKNEKFLSGLYKVIGYKECGQFQHWLVFKTRNYLRFDLEPYSGIFFIITDKNQKGVSNLKLAENSNTMMITSTKDSLASKISTGNLVSTKTFTNSCSDVLDKNGRMTCWTKVITTVNKISCNKIGTVGSDTTVTVNVY